MQLPVTLEDLHDAFERVCENDGCAGVDGVTLRAFGRNAGERLQRLVALVEADRYLPYPLLKIVIEKKPGSDKTRTLLVPAVRDRVLQTAIARQLSHSFEEEFLECSFAYRPGRGVDRAVARIRELHSQGYRFVLDGDITTFFDEVDHDLLLERLAAHGITGATGALTRQWIRGEFWDGERLHPIRKGIPQGSPISPLLANFFLEDFDRELEKSTCRLVRYADDFLILAKTRPEAERALGETTEFLHTQHLEMNAAKTSVVDFDQGFHFLGVFFRGDDIWTPWKTDRKPGRLLFMAHPLPARLRRRYEDGPVMQTAMKAAFHKAWAEERPPEAERSGSVAFLYLTQQGAVLRKAGDRLLVERNDEILFDSPYHKLDHVLTFGNVQITTQALAELLDKGVPLSLFSRQGQFRGALTPARGKNVELRLKQFQAYSDGARSLDLARSFIAAKISNGAAVVARYSARAAHDEDRIELNVSERLRAVAEARHVAELDGVEGTAARDYFETAMRFNKSELRWEGRKRHPATDPINALLSLTYTLLMHELGAVLEGLGLDPYLGFLHQLDYGRPSLALDAVEPFRHPVADRLVLALVNKKVIGAADFQAHEDREGLFLKPLVLVRFFESYEKWMLNRPPGQVCFRERMHHEAERLVAAIRDGTPFEPYRFDHETEEECFTSSVTI